MIDRAHDLPITKQAEALNISRGSVYYLPRPVSDADLAIMRRLTRVTVDATCWEAYPSIAGPAADNAHQADRRRRWPFPGNS